MSILWGGNIVAIRIGVANVPPLWSAFWRMFLGVLIVAIWARSRGVGLWPARGEGRPLLILGVLFAVQIALLNLGTAYTSPGYAVVILNSYAVFANLTGHFLAGHSVAGNLEQPLTRGRSLGLVLALAGVGILAFGQEVSELAPRPLLGNFLIVVSTALLGFRQVYTRWIVQSVDPVRTIVWQMLWSMPLFLAAAAFFEPPVVGSITWQAVAALAYQGWVVAGICFVIWASLLKHHSAGTLSMFAFLVPFSGIALSALLFREPMRVELIVGGILVLAGVWVVTRMEVSES